MKIEFDVGNYNLGADAFKQKKYEKSVGFYTLAIEDNPLYSFSQAYLWRGLSYYFLNDFENAIKDFDVANNENELKVRNWRGLSYKQLGRYSEAITDLKKAIEIEPKFREAYIDLYEIGFLIDDSKLVADHFNALINLGRSNINLFISRADENGNNSKCELAIKMCDFILNKIPDERNSIIVKATCNAKLMNYGLALNDFDKFISLNPQDPTGYFNKAILLRELNRDGSNSNFLQAYELGMPEAKQYITR